MSRDKIYNFSIDGENVRGTKDKVINFLEAMGYKYERYDKNPHIFWQYSEHFKRIHG